MRLCPASNEASASLITSTVRGGGTLVATKPNPLTPFAFPNLQTSQSFIGAAAAAIIRLRRKLDGSLLSYWDRGRVKKVIILGFAFGEVIGMFAGCLSKSLEGDDLGLSALALLASYNFRAVSQLLEDFSQRGSSARLAGCASCSANIAAGDDFDPFQPAGWDCPGGCPAAALIRTQWLRAALRRRAFANRRAH